MARANRHRKATLPVDEGVDHEEFIHRKNLELFRRRLADATLTEAHRKVILLLLAEEQVRQCHRSVPATDEPCKPKYRAAQHLKLAGSTSMQWGLQILTGLHVPHIKIASRNRINGTDFQSVGRRPALERAVSMANSSRLACSPVA